VENNGENIKKAEYAGLYYPSDPTELVEVIEQKIGEFGTFGPDLNNLQVRALIVPSGGYSYSGKVAAAAYKELYGRKFKKVVLVGSTHFINFEGIALSTADYFETPLGKIHVDKAAVEHISKKVNFAFNDLAFAKEYSLELQLPFLQKILGEFELIPMVTGGKTNYKEIAQEVAELLTDDVLIVISSNLSHFLDEKSAREADQLMIESLKEMNSEKIINDGEASALFALVTVNEIALIKGWTPIFLGYSNSAEAGDDPASVVGYGSLIYFSV
jgi:MEMO1 family protein